MRAELRVRSGPSYGAHFHLDRLGSYIIGRRTESDVALRGKAVSRKHCRIDYDGDSYWIVDCDSHNGTFVNGRQIKRCMLYDGDLIRVGKVELDFLLPGADEEPGE
jgi:pSer/pThr/pTyr-binding forkhead associated (FHA) protein